MKKQQSKNQNQSFRSLFLVLFMFVMFGFTSNSYSQSIKVNGTITDTKGTPFPGATVTIKSNQSIGVQSDFDGNYSLEIPADATQLEVSYTGYATQTVDIGNLSVVDVALSAGAILDEIVVTGYGTQKSKEVTGSITSVKAEDFNQGNVNDASQLLQGKVAGLVIARPGANPNGGFNIRLRGLSTVGAFNLSSQLDINVSKRVKTIDQNAAAFILQGAIDYLNN